MNGFFNFRKLVVGVMAATCFMGFQSCLDDDDDKLSLRFYGDL